MTVWILHLPFTPDDEAQITKRDTLELPFGDVADLSRITSEAQARQLVKTLHPELPPEAIMRQVDRFWHRYMTLGKEDIIAVPMTQSKKVMIAEVTGPYRHAVGEQGKDLHLIPVTWKAGPIEMKKFARHKSLFAGEGLREVTDKEERIAIRNFLPHGYNRFVKLRWLLVIFFIMGAIKAIEHVMHP